MQISAVGLLSGGAIQAHNHRHENETEFHFFVEGEGRFRNCDRDYEYRPGLLFYSNPDETHSTDPHIRSTFYFVRIAEPEPEFIGLVQELFDLQPARFIGTSATLVFEEIRVHSLSPSLAAQRSALHRLLALLYDSAAGLPKLRAGANDSYTERAIMIMLAQLERGLDLGELVKTLELDKSYFIRLFKKATGTTPLKYFTALKIDAAKNLLDFSGLSVKEIAYELGYSDEFHFSHVFKRVTSLSPRDHRRFLGS
jgi:AraC-like DNA-binding protein